MSDSNRYSRMHKFEKRRKNTKAITILVVIGSALAILLIATIMFPSKDESVTKSEDNQSNEIQHDETESNDEDKMNDLLNDELDNDEQLTVNTVEENATNDEKVPDEDHVVDPEEEVNQVITEPIESTEDNVIEAYTGNWEPIGTKQEEPHTIQFDKNTQDWLEMEQAIRLATGLDEMTTLWIGNGGDQKVIGTVTSMDGNNIYRVYLTWITNEGWQPTKVERLKENDIGNS